jgi:invasion protein IalB
MMAAAKVSVAKAVTTEAMTTEMTAAMAAAMAATMTTAVAATMTAPVATASASRQRRAWQQDCQHDGGNSNDRSLHRTLPYRPHHRGIGI